MQHRYLAHVCSWLIMVIRESQSTPRSFATPCDLTMISHIQTIKCNFAQLSAPEQNQFRFLLVKFQEVSVHPLPDVEKTILHTIPSISPISLVWTVIWTCLRIIIRPIWYYNWTISFLSCIGTVSATYPCWGEHWYNDCLLQTSLNKLKFICLWLAVAAMKDFVSPA